MSELTGNNHRCRAQFKCAQTVLGQCFAGNGPIGLYYYYYYYYYYSILLLLHWHYSAHTLHYTDTTLHTHLTIHARISLHTTRLNALHYCRQTSHCFCAHQSVSVNRSFHTKNTHSNPSLQCLRQPVCCPAHYLKTGGDDMSLWLGHRGMRCSKVGWANSIRITAS